MKNKISSLGKVLTAVVLMAGVISAESSNNPPCVPSSQSGAVCGSSSSPNPNYGCIATYCSTTDMTCSGPSTDYYCNSAKYSATCTQYQETLYWDTDGQGYCDQPSTYLGTISAGVCHQITGEVGGCGA